MSAPVARIADRCRVATRVLALLRVHGERGKAGVAPDFDVLDSLLAYVERTVRSVHYVQEEAHIARPLEQLRPDLRLPLGRLRRMHVGAGGYCYRMREALTNWKKGWSKATDIYLDNARDHHRLGVSHGRLMRQTILPAAQGAFSHAQWEALDTAMAKTSDPLSGCLSRPEFEAGLRQVMGRESVVAPVLMQIKAANGQHRILDCQ